MASSTDRILLLRIKRKLNYYIKISALHKSGTGEGDVEYTGDIDGWNATYL